MGLGIGNLISTVVSVPGQLIKQIGHELLPDELDFLADLGALAFNLHAGNFAGAATDFLDFARDFRLAERLGGSLGAAEPEPPRSSEWHQVDNRNASEGDGPMTHAAGQGGDPVVKVPGRPERPAGPTSEAGSAQADNASTGKPSGSKPSGGKPSAGKPSGSKPSGGKPSGSKPSGGKPTSTKPAGKPSGNSSTSKTDGQVAAEKFIKEHSDPEKFMAAIRKGNLPADVADSQSAMLMIQQKMGDIQRMFQLMTQMLHAMHETQMGIVRNVRA